MTEITHEQFFDYIGELFVEEDDVLKEIRAEAERQGLPLIGVRPYDGYLLGWLARLVNAKRIVEIGTLGGYSGTWIALNMPKGGHLYTFEREPKHAEVAQANFERAGVNDKVTVIQGVALEMLTTIEDKGPFDMVFIDADKVTYPEYLAWAIENLREGGLVAGHNAFRRGGAIQPKEEGDAELQVFNHMLAKEPRLDGMIIPLGDGMAVGIKRTF